MLYDQDYPLPMINENASFAEDRPALRLPQVFEPNNKTSLTDELRQLSLIHI